MQKRSASDQPDTISTETDSLVAIDVPMAALWGPQTALSLRFFAIGQQTMPLEIIHAMAQIKRAAAETHLDLGLLDEAMAHAIAHAAERVATGEFDDQFPLSVWQTGSGTQSHMNVNEVIAKLATRALYRQVHPHDDVNRGQSSNDVFPSAMHIAVVQLSRALLISLAGLRDALQRKADSFGRDVKIGRTHLQDAIPITWAQEFSGYLAQLGLAERAIRHALPAVYELAIGGTAVGTGLNTHPAFGQQVAQRLAERLDEPFVVAPNLFAALAGHEALVSLHGALRTLCVALIKIGSDIRLMGSGPRAGIGELQLPANEPGSSIMPGKVNPTQIEALLMVCAQVMGHDVAIGIAASQGQFELNVYKPLIAYNSLDSLRLLSDAMSSFASHCVDGIQIDTAHSTSLLHRSLMLVTALVPHMGYDRAALIALRAHAQGSSLREAAIEVGGISAAEFDAWVNPEDMVGNGRTVKSAAGPSGSATASPSHP